MSNFQDPPRWYLVTFTVLGAIAALVVVDYGNGSWLNWWGPALVGSLIGASTVVTGALLWQAFARPDRKDEDEEVEP